MFRMVPFWLCSRCGLPVSEYLQFIQKRMLFNLFLSVTIFFLRFFSFSFLILDCWFLEIFIHSFINKSLLDRVFVYLSEWKKERERDGDSLIEEERSWISFKGNDDDDEMIKKRALKTDQIIESRAQLNLMMNFIFLHSGSLCLFCCVFRF